MGSLMRRIAPALALVWLTTLSASAQIVVAPNTNTPPIPGGVFTSPLKGPDGAAAATTYGFSSEAGLGLLRGGAGKLDVSAGSTVRFRFTDLAQFLTQSAGVFGWTNGTAAAGTLDTGISRLSAGVLGIGNGTAGDASGTLKVTTLTGPAATNLSVNTVLGTSLLFQVNNSTQAQVTASGLQITAGNFLYMGGTTASYPALKRNGTGIDVRLADDSGYAALTASTVTATSAFLSPSGTSSNVSYGFSTEANTGLFLAAAATPRLVAGGTTIWTATTSGFSLNQPITAVGGVSTTGSYGVPLMVGTTGLLSAQGANIGSTNLVASAPVDGLYEICAWSAVTRAATSSSTRPVLSLGWNNGTASIAGNMLASDTTNTTTGSWNWGCTVIHSAAGQAITYSTSSYASVGATSMQYELWVEAHLKK